MADYGPVIGRDGAGSQRARDFIDIHALLNEPRFRVDLAACRPLEPLWHV